MKSKLATITIILTCSVIVGSYSLPLGAAQRSRPPQFRIQRECDGGLCHFETVSFKYPRVTISVGYGDLTLFYYFSVETFDGKLSRRYVIADNSDGFVEKDTGRKVDASFASVLMDVYKLGVYVITSDLPIRNRLFSETDRFSVLANLRNQLTSQRPPNQRGASAARKNSVPPEHPITYTENGRCPFECCTYRQWRAAKSTPVFASANPNATQIRILKAGEYVRAVTGFVRTHGAEFVVSRNTGQYRVGDVIWVYSYRGEGFFTVWFKGKMYGEELGFSPSGGTGGTRCQEAPNYCWGTLKTELQSEWWIKLRLRDGRIGWTNRGEDFSNTDACS